MTTLNVYLYFNGNCEAAFLYYSLVFGKKIQYIGRFKDMHPDARLNFPDHTDEHIMHVTLPISQETMIMGADSIDHENKTATKINNFSLYVRAESKSEADRLFLALSKDGTIILPISDQFWGSYYGNCQDQFGINWKISFTAEDYT